MTSPKLKASTWPIALCLSSLLLLGVFQNCDRPYNLELSDPEVTEASSAEGPVVINGGGEITNEPNLKINLQREFAHEASVSFEVECKGSWTPMARTVEIPWLGGDGLVEVFVKFRNFRKEETPCFSRRIVIDTTAPSLTFLQKSNTISKSRTAEFLVEAEELTSRLASVECRLLTGAAVANPAGSQVRFEECGLSTKFFSLPDNSYRIEFRASDRAGNTSDLLVHNWVVDSRVPDLQVTTAPARYTSVLPAVFEFNSGNSVAITGYTCQINSNPKQACASPFVMPALADGTYTVKIEAVGVNEISAQVEHTFSVDTVKPTLTVGRTPLASTRGRVQTFEFLASDSAGPSGLEVKCQLNVAPEQPCTTATSYISPALADGTHVLRISVLDRAKNRSIQFVYNFTVDSTRPVVSLQAETQPAPATKSRSAAFRYTIADLGTGLDTVTCQLDTGPINTTCNRTATNFYNLADGPHTFRLIATDKVGNSVTYQHTWRIDNVAPVIEVTRFPAPTTSVKTAQFFFSTSDDGGTGIQSRQCQLDSNPVVNCASGVKYFITVKGTHRWRLTVTDRAGNVRVSTVHWNLQY